MPDDWKFHEYALADVISVLHFRLSQRGLTDDTPINWLLGAVNKALLHDVRKKAQFVRFIFFVQRKVGIFPIAQNSKAFELGALNIDKAFRIFGAAGANLFRR